MGCMSDAATQNAIGPSTDPWTTLEFIEAIFDVAVHKGLGRV